MKKLFAVLLAVTLLCGLLAVSATAATDPLAEKFQDELRLLDHFYDYNRYYMIRIASDYFVGYDNMGPVTVGAAEFEGKLRQHFVLSDQQLESIRSYYEEDYFVYDADEQTYTVSWVGGFGGGLPAREYWGYVKNGETYDVYYRGIVYAFLADVLPDGVSEWEYAESLGYPMEIEYNGVIYESGMDGYCAIVGYQSAGRKYSVELNGNIVRIISVSNYSGNQAPSKFDDKVPTVEYDVPADNSVTIPENDCFAVETVVKVEKVTAGSTMQTAQDAMQTVAEKFVAFEFTATKDGAAVQPNGTLAVTFAIPAGYSTNVKVYYMAKNGALENVAATVNAADRTVTAQLTHFSTYILADADSQPVVTPSTQPTTATTAPTTESTTASTTAPADPTTESTTVTTTAPTTAPTTVSNSTQPTTTTNENGADNSDSNTGLIIAIVAAAIVPLIIVITEAGKGKKSKNKRKNGRKK